MPPAWGCGGLQTLSSGVAGSGDSPHPPQELFKKVEPRHCLGFVWCQRPNGSQEYLAPTVRATINQFLHVSGCVITTCLGDLSMTAQDRARVVELWIQVAKVSSGRAQGAPPWSQGDCPFSSRSFQP